MLAARPLTPTSLWSVYEMLILSRLQQYTTTLGMPVGINVLFIYRTFEISKQYHALLFAVFHWDALAYILTPSLKFLNQLCILQNLLRVGESPNDPGTQAGNSKVFPFLHCPYFWPD